jgi:hypothetical protein
MISVSRLRSRRRDDFEPEFASVITNRSSALLADTLISLRNVLAART